MLETIAEIKRFLANKHSLPLENPNSILLIRVVGQVPDGEHVIPLGKNGKKYKVAIVNDSIQIGDEVEEMA